MTNVFDQKFNTSRLFDFGGESNLSKINPEIFMPKNQENIYQFSDKEDSNTFLGRFLENLDTYDPEKKEKESDSADDLLESFARRAKDSNVSKIGTGLTLVQPRDDRYERAQIEMYNQQQEQERQEQKRNVGRMAGAAIGNAIVPGVGGVVGGLLGGLFCDIRLKEDIAPLCKSEVNDVLSECAFFVKDLNECS